MQAASVGVHLRRSDSSFDTLPATIGTYAPDSSPVGMRKAIAPRLPLDLLFEARRGDGAVSGMRSPQHTGSKSAPVYSRQQGARSTRAPPCMRCGTAKNVVPWLCPNTWYCFGKEGPSSLRVCGNTWATDTITPRHPKPISRVRAAFETEKQRNQRVLCRSGPLRLELHFGIAGYACVVCHKFIPLSACRIRSLPQHPTTSEATQDTSTASASSSEIVEYANYASTSSTAVSSN